MKSAAWVLGLALCFGVGAVGCSGADEDDGSTAADEGALTVASLSAGSTAVTTARLNVRDDANTSAEILTILPRGAKVTITGAQEGNFYPVKLANGTEGFCHGGYLQAAGGGTTNPGNPNPGPSGNMGGSFPTSGDIFNARGTAYFPENSAMEGGFFDRKGAKLRTLQQYLNGDAEYVSVAMDTNAFSYGQKLRIKEIEEKYGRAIEFRVVDTGGAFRNKGRSRIDVCVANSAASNDSAINRQLTLAVVN